VSGRGTCGVESSYVERLRRGFGCKEAAVKR
jgi:hypothetical protein